MLRILLHLFPLRQRIEVEVSAVHRGTDVVLHGVTALMFAVWEIVNIAPWSLTRYFLYLGY